MRVFWCGWAIHPVMLALRVTTEAKIPSPLCLGVTPCTSGWLPTWPQRSRGSPVWVVTSPRSSRRTPLWASTTSTTRRDRAPPLNGHRSHPCWQRRGPIWPSWPRRGSGWTEANTGGAKNVASRSRWRGSRCARWRGPACSALLAANADQDGEPVGSGWGPPPVARNGRWPAAPARPGADRAATEERNTSFVQVALSSGRRPQEGGSLLDGGEDPLGLSIDQRERDTLQHLAEGCTNEPISVELAR